jgi:hypothetical protein
LQKFRRTVWVVLSAIPVVLLLHLMHLLLAGGANDEVGSLISDSFNDLA